MSPVENPNSTRAAATSIDDACSLIASNVNVENGDPIAAYATDLSAHIVEHIGMAVEQGWIRPYYQPVIRSLTGKLCGFEALARWEDPAYGILPPSVFVPALEEAKLIHLLDCSIVRQVCKQYRECVNRGEQVVPVSFNLSRLDFDLCDIFAEVEHAAHEYEVPRRMLNIEITETILGSDPTYMAEMMGRFRNAGYQVWMDDFGSGYSTLNVLKDFDFNELKIDMEFLNKFGTKSKTILASVVDMAKKLGLQTLAEGVETEEHLAYLKRIGCEKMQGFLFGKPRPYTHENGFGLPDSLEIETTAERLYLDEVGAVNTLSLSERDLTSGSSTHGYVTSMPLATIEFSDDSFRIIDWNRVFREGLAGMGISTVEEAEELINNTQRRFAQQARRLVETIDVDKFARLDYVGNGVDCIIRAKHIASRDGKTALLASITDTIEQDERKRHGRMDESLAVMYTIYEHVDIIHLDEERIEPVFGNIGLRAHLEAPQFHDITQHFAETEVYVRDRERYIKFMEHSTMIERIRATGENFMTGFFRIRQHGGDYAWKVVGLILMEDQPGEQVMLCIRSAHWKYNSLFQETFDHHLDLSSDEIENADTDISDASLWRSLARDEHLMLFWKDGNRRFIDANQAFLDYYGFDSADEIRGKTDEDMGWHIDPKPFMDDEWHVLNEGACIQDVAGQCIVRGEVRDIIATKRPVYSNGQIVGLVGYFADVNNENNTNEELKGLPIRDSITGVLNYTGLEAATWKFVDAYKRQGVDFVMISVNVESFQTINNEFGYEFGEKVLKRVADELLDIAGNKCVIGHVYADRFVILAQSDCDERMQQLCDDIERRLWDIASVDGKSCTIYALAGFARFSKIGDIEDMKRYNRDHRLERRDHDFNGLNENGSDIITSSLL